MKRLAVALAALCIWSQAWAAEKAGWQGAGTMLCSEFEQAISKHSEDENLFFSWAQGFMSGLNTDLLPHGGTDLNELPMQMQKQAIRSYCNDHPRASYFEAVFKLYNRMRRDQSLPSYFKTWPKGAPSSSNPQ